MQLGICAPAVSETVDPLPFEQHQPVLVVVYLLHVQVLPRLRRACGQRPLASASDRVLQRSRASWAREALPSTLKGRCLNRRGARNAR